MRSRTACVIEDAFTRSRPISSTSEAVGSAAERLPLRAPPLLVHYATSRPVLSPRSVPRSHCSNGVINARYVELRSRRTSWDAGSCWKNTFRTNTAAITSIVYLVKSRGRRIVISVNLQRPTQVDQDHQIPGCHTWLTPILRSLHQSGQAEGTLPKPLRSPNMPLQAKLILYKSLIRAIITCVSPVWCNISQTQFNPLEPIQNRTLRFITNSSSYLYIPTLRNSAGSLEPLQEHIHTLNRFFYEKQSSNPDTNPTLTSLLTAKHKSRTLRKSQKRKRIQDSPKDITRRSTASEDIRNTTTARRCCGSSRNGPQVQTSNILWFGKIV